MRITSLDDSRSCPASMFCQPFETEVTGLRPGQYEIRVEITSVAKSHPAVVTVTGG